MHSIYIITGSNIGDRLKNLTVAKHHLENSIGKILQSSSIYETAPWGKSDQENFYNQVHLMQTSSDARSVMEKCLSIETCMGRIRTIKNAPRLIDLDILFFDDNIIDLPDLKIPHPEIPNRRFVLEPMAELAPELLHPGLDKTIKTLLTETRDSLVVTKATGI
jgi:2-amino-4-hydroxy-6-hydroxymethyldihydropteridine diphosphokinase